jgi:hypothetical protein
MTPVAGGVADRQQHGLPGLLRKGEGLITPRIPIDGVIGVLQEIRAGFFGEAI